jgi:hypothetical protein
MTWQWSQSANRYRDSETGQFLSQEQALEFVQQSLNATDSVTDVLASYVRGEPLLISVKDWRTAMRREIKDEYIRQYLLGRGGREQMTAVDWGSVGGMLREQYRYLDTFAEDLEATGIAKAMYEASEITEEQYQATVTTELQTAARARMYINSAREAYERAQRRVADEAGYDEVRWVLDPAVENCDDCIAFDGLGWTTIADNAYSGCYPGSGCTQCLTNCACHFEYRATQETEYD